MIKEISSEQDWSNFVLAQHPNTFLHSWEWGQVQQQDGHDIRYLGIFNGQQQTGAALVITLKARRGRHYLIPHGPIISEKTPAFDQLSELVGYLKTTAKQDRVVALRIAPLLESNAKNQSYFASLGFRQAPLHVHAELTWLRDISGSEADLLADLRKTTRHAITKAQRAGVTTQVLTSTSALDRFMPLYSATGQRHQFVTYSRSLLAAQLEIFGQHDRIYAIIASHQGKDIAAAICIQYGQTVFYYHGASAGLTSSVPASQLVQWQAILEAKRRGATRYNFWGIAPADKPKHPFAGITIFKKGFGGFAVEYLPAQDLPLGLGYLRLWAADTYRRLRRGF